ncbi:MAG: hypothetical protein R3F07_14210 [Opitutaceae bacterium]
MGSSFKVLAWWGFLILVLTVQGADLDLDAILARHREAIGGTQALGRLNTLRASGIVLISRQRAPYELWAAFPNRLRIESTIGERVLVQSYDGKNPPWTWFPETIYALPEEMNEVEAGEFISDADFTGPLINPRGKGNELTLIGEETLNGQKVFRLKLVEGGGQESSILIDGESFLIACRSGVRRGGGAQIELDTFYLDYRKVAGVMLPFRYEVYRGTSLVRTVLVQSMEGNVPIPPALFGMPEGPDPVKARIEIEARRP